MYMMYIPVYSVYAIYRGIYVSIVMYTCMYMVYIPVYSVHAIYRALGICQYHHMCMWCIFLYIVYLPYTEGHMYMSLSSCIWCIYVYEEYRSVGLPHDTATH